MPAAQRAAFLPPGVQAALLAAIAGYVDAVGFLRYQGFACQITGNTVLLALALFHGSWEQSLYYVAMMVCFTIGVLLASGLIRFGRSPSLVLSIIGLKWVSPLLGLAMGMQTAAATRFGKATLNTVFITGDVQRLSKASSPSSGRGRGPRRPPMWARWPWSGWSISVVP